MHSDYKYHQDVSSIISNWWNRLEIYKYWDEIVFFHGKISVRMQRVNTYNAGIGSTEQKKYICFSNFWNVNVYFMN